MSIWWSSSTGRDVRARREGEVGEKRQGGSPAAFDGRLQTGVPFAGQSLGLKRRQLHYAPSFAGWGLARAQAINGPYPELAIVGQLIKHALPRAVSVAGERLTQFGRQGAARRNRGRLGRDEEGLRDRAIEFDRPPRPRASARHDDQAESLKRRQVIVQPFELDTGEVREFGG
jgi:hypothetical protein